MGLLDPATQLGLLRLISAPDVGPVVWARVLAAWRSGKTTFPEFFTLSAQEYVERYRLRPSVAAELVARRAEVERKARELDAEMAGRGIELLVDRGLPSGFPLLFSHGNLELREEPAVALLASRDADDRAIEVAERIANAVAGGGAHIVTGTNRPVYKAAGVAARRHAAPLTLVLDRGLLAAWGEEWGREPLAAARIWDERFDTELSLALSPFRLQDAWVTSNARRRDQLICAWAQVLIGVSLRPGGGLDALCRAAVARGATVILVEECVRNPALAAIAGARHVAAARAAEAALAAVGPPGLGRRRAELRARAGFARAIARACGGASGRDVRDLLPPEDGPAFAYPPPRDRKQPKVAVLLVEAERGVDPERSMIGWLGDLRPGGVLVALLPSSFMEEGTAAALRGRLLAQGELQAAITLPGDQALLVLRKGSAATATRDAAALVITPTRPLSSAADRRRYLDEALRRFRSRLSPPSPRAY